MSYCEWKLNTHGGYTTSCGMAYSHRCYSCSGCPNCVKEIKIVEEKMIKETREVLFRETRQDKKTGAKTYHHFSLDECIATDSWEGKLPYIVIATDQFTGVSDRNGKKIYEHDSVIWRCSGSMTEGKVVWKDSGWNVIDLTGDNSTRLGECSSIEVIGDER